jgi:hypothetical protein
MSRVAFTSYSIKEDNLIDEQIDKKILKDLLTFKGFTTEKEAQKKEKKKTFTFTLYNVPKGHHELTLTVIFHEGTRNQTTSYFNVLT